MENEENHRAAGREAAHPAATAERPTRAGQPAAQQAPKAREGERRATAPADRSARRERAAARKREHGGTPARPAPMMNSAPPDSTRHHARASASGNPAPARPGPGAAGA